MFLITYFKFGWKSTLISKQSIKFKTHLKLNNNHIYIFLYIFSSNFNLD